jgi:hypothetical protein
MNSLTIQSVVNNCFDVVAVNDNVSINLMPLTAGNDQTAIFHKTARLTALKAANILSGSNEHFNSWSCLACLAVSENLVVRVECRTFASDIFPGKFPLKISPSSFW